MRIVYDTSSPKDPEHRSKYSRSLNGFCRLKANESTRLKERERERERKKRKEKLNEIRLFIHKSENKNQSASLNQDHFDRGGSTKVEVVAPDN